LMVVDHNTPSNYYSLIRITYDESKDLASQSQDVKVGDSMETNDIIASFNGLDQEKSLIKFQITDKISKKVENLEFSLGWWASWINYQAWYTGEEYQNSGVYIFRPMDGQEEAFPYSELK